MERWGSDAVLGREIPVRLLRRMTACSNVYAAMASYIAGSHRLADWARANPTYLQIVMNIRLMRLQNA